MTVAIKSKQVIIAADRQPIAHGVVLVDGQLIHAVVAADDPAITPETEVIDCSAYTVMPGMIDSHIHISNNNKYRLSLTEMSQADTITASAWGVMSLRDDLASGVTTMRTLGDRDDLELRMKLAIEKGYIVGPRLSICIRALRPSHGTAPMLAYAADGPDEIRKAIRQNFQKGADLVKLFVTNVANGGEFLDYLQGDLTRVPAYSKSEIVAAVEEARFLGMPVATHAIGGPAMRWAMEAGVDSVEHGNLLEEQDLEYFARYGTFLSDPNLHLFFDDEIGFPSFSTWQYDWWRPKVLEAKECTARYLPQLVKNGTKVCLAGDSTHASLWREAKYMVEIGCSPQDALLAVTRNSAELLRLADKIGTLEAGKYADIIAVEGDPLTNITALREVRMVMKEGRQYTFND
jgi:imidazolonepropionase-like amidohydrolase